MELTDALSRDIRMGGGGTSQNSTAYISFLFAHGKIRMSFILIKSELPE